MIDIRMNIDQCFLHADHHVVLSASPFSLSDSQQFLFNISLIKDDKLIFFIYRLFFKRFLFKKFLVAIKIFQTPVGNWTKNIRDFHDLSACKVSCVECKMCDSVFQKFEHHFRDKHTEFFVVDYQSKFKK